MLNERSRLVIDVVILQGSTTSKYPVIPTNFWMKQSIINSYDKTMCARKNDLELNDLIRKYI